MTNWLTDLRLGFRALLRSPGFTVGAILVLAPRDRGEHRDFFHGQCRPSSAIAL